VLVFIANHAGLKLTPKEAKKYDEPKLGLVEQPADGGTARPQLLSVYNHAMSGDSHFMPWLDWAGLP